MHFNNPTQQKMKIKNMTTLHSRKSIGRSLSWRCGFVLVPLALVCFGLSPTAKAVLPPPAPDGGYPGANTAEGDFALLNLTSGINNTAVGKDALLHNTTGGFNVGIGSGALASNTTGSFNMAVGTQALTNNTANFNLAIGFRVGFMNTTGRHLTGIGAGALQENTTASFNTAIGAAALHANTTGEDNTAIGADALTLNIDGASNTAVGFQALENNDSSGNALADRNTAVGSEALEANVDGVDNTAVGSQALQSNTTGQDNTAVGSLALNANIAGGANSAFGLQALTKSTAAFAFSDAFGWLALFNNTTGSVNNAFGSTALFNNIDGSHNAGFGDRALFFNQHGFVNTAIGDRAGENILGTGNVCIGFNVFGAPTDNFTIRIGDNLSTTAGASQCFIGGIFNQTGGTQFVAVNSAGKLGFFTSSRRFKDEIKPMDQASEVIYSLKPVSFRYKAEIEPSRPLSFGLVAEDVEKISPDLVMRDADGNANTVRYEAVNAMLLNEFLKEHKKVQELEATVAQQQKGMEVLTAQLKEQAAQIQKVSARLEVSKPTPQVVGNQ
jgi:trimeric autotransporter adhesin